MRTWLVTGMPSAMLYANQIKINANKTPLGLLLVGGTRCFEQAMDWCLLVEGEYKIYHFVWEPPIMCVAWKISRSLGCYVDNESIPLKILFTSISKPSSGTSTNPCFPLRRAYLFTLMLSHHPLIKKHQLETPLSFASITVSLHWVWLQLDLFYHELQCLVSHWSLKVICIYVLRSQKGLARYHLVISYYDCFEKVLSSEFYYYSSLADYAIDRSKHET